MADPVRLAVGGRSGRWRDWLKPVAGWALAVLTLCTAVIGSIVRPPAPLLLWNASPSSALGLYAVTSARSLRTGGVAIAWAPPLARRIAAFRLYIPSKVPLVKRIAATAGDRVCARRQRIFVNGHLVAVRRARDPSGRPMPWWSGCRRLKPGEAFLLSADPLAFDGRYFGVTHPAELVGKATLLWAR